MIFRNLKPASELKKIIDHADDETELSNQLAIYFSENFVITVRREAITWIEHFLLHPEQNIERLFGGKSDSLAHALIDILIDNFKKGIDVLEGIVDKLEDSVVSHQEALSLPYMLEIKRRLNGLKLITRDHRSVISRLTNRDYSLIHQSQKRYFQDIEDHAQEIIYQIDNQLDNLLNIRDAYLAIANVRLGDIMRILAVITTVFTPLNVLVGVYGMNFQVMPLLHSPHGFWVLLTSMAIMIILMMIYFRKKKWI